MTKILVSYKNKDCIADYDSKTNRFFIDNKLLTDNKKPSLPDGIYIFENSHLILAAGDKMKDSLSIYKIVSN